MPAVLERSRITKKETTPQGASNRPAFSRSEALVLVLLACAGAILSLAAPGFDQWYLTWFGLVPLMVAVFAAKRPVVAFGRAFVFGLVYNLCYWHWLLLIHPLMWIGIAERMPHAIGVIGWLVICTQQGLIVAAFAYLARKMPLVAGFLPRRVKGRIHLPAFLIVPILWVAVLNKLGNAHEILGVPWSMIEYSQYQLSPILSLAPFVGGIGIGAILVLSNLLIFSSAATAIPAFKDNPLRFRSVKEAALTTVLAAAALTVAVLLCQNHTPQPGSKPEKIAVLQGNISSNIHKATAEQVVLRYLNLASHVPRDRICVWPEWAFPAYVSKGGPAFQFLAGGAKKLGQDWIVGVLDQDDKGRAYNSICAFSAKHGLLKDVYHKRYLVPFGEYTPTVFLPLGFLMCTGAPGDTDYASGMKAVSFDLSGHKIAPLICFETISPELVTDCVRSGNQLLVNCGNTSWCNSPHLARQMIAFCAVRAAESHRCFVFSSTVGPSAIIDENGRIVKISAMNRDCSLSGPVRYFDDITPFSRWFF